MDSTRSPTLGINKYYHIFVNSVISSTAENCLLFPPVYPLVIYGIYYQNILPIWKTHEW